MGGEHPHETPITFNDVNLPHELDDYINGFAYEDQPSLFFDDAFLNPLDETSAIDSLQFDIPDTAIDPELRGACDIPKQECVVDIPTQLQSQPPIYPPSLSSKPSNRPSRDFESTSTNSQSGKKLLRKSKKEESTFDYSRQAKAPTFDPRLYELARRSSKTFKCLPSSAAYPQNATYVPYSGHLVAAPGLIPQNGVPNDGDSSSLDINQKDIDDFFASLNPEFLEKNIDDVFSFGTVPDYPEWQQQYETPTRRNVIDAKEFTYRMLAPSALPVQPSEKRKRGRPKKDEVEESHQDAAPQPPHSVAPFQAPHQEPQFGIQQHHLSPQYPTYQSIHQQPYPYPQTFPSTSTTAPDPNTPYFVTALNLNDIDDAGTSSKRRRIVSSGSYRSMSKKEQAYMEMDAKVKLYDETNIHELLYFPILKPGRSPCYWIQRHPYANTRVYEDHYRTWCRYRHCKGVETAELIRTASGEVREKNYKHPRTIIAGNYQVAVDWEYVGNEINTFKNDSEGQYEYDKRNVYDTVECFFHLRCFEQLTDFPQLVRQQRVQIDHRVLNADKTRNKITKRKNKGGTNAAEIEWYLKDEAEQWVHRTTMDWSFNPLPGSEDSLERVLLNGKRRYNERKGTGKLGFGASPIGSPPSEF
ncbi:hypothetical protein TWF694_009008 [Orbilia ellipsospora]|uniref:Uncharacterized protein n=1 Tax=Orbilia ellipsospora TaxID=2528407 RepID=A0AAV9XDK6_9PEZI